MKYIKLYEDFNGYEGLKYLLDEHTNTIGDEKKIPIGDDIYLYKSDAGSYRFIKKVNNVNVSAIQIMFRKGQQPYATNAFTLPEYRRKGIALELLKKAEIYFEQPLNLSNDVSELGSKLKKSYYK
ncbi:MAG: hypothetical protein RLZZ546_547 [Bacteroidota bacterium]|jgi:GNAT superfamily N-acetyltransferase